MAILTVDTISQLPLDETRFCGAKVNCRPPRGQDVSIYALEVDGWVLSRTVPPVAVEVIEAGLAIYRVPVQLRWQEPMAAFPGVPHADRCAFRVLVSALRLPPRFELLLQVHLEDGSCVPFCTVRGQRGPLQFGSDSKLLPLMVTTLGRTGSTWLVALLAQHPQLVAYRPFDYETRVTSYWLAVLRALGEPISYTQCLRGELSAGPWWLGDNRPSAAPPLPADPEIRQWFGGAHIRALAAFCRNRIETFFEQVAAVQRRSDARFFVEKFYPERFQAAMVRELFSAAGEVFLVRDFRDMYSSMLSFGKKIGRPTFGRELTKTDEEFLRLIRDQAARLLESWNERSGTAYLLRYEDLIQTPEIALRALLERFALDSSVETIQNMLRRAPEVMPESQRFHQTSGAPAESIGRWRQDMGPALQGVAREAFGGVLKAFGYGPE